MFPNPWAEMTPLHKKTKHLAKMRIIMSSITTTKTVSILRDRWRHNRKLMDKVRHPKPEPSAPLPEHVRDWDKGASKERPQQEIDRSDFFSKR